MERPRNCFNLKDTKRHDITQDFELDPLSVKDILGQLETHE